MTTIPTITPSLRLVWLREHASHCALLARIARMRPAVDPAGLLELRRGLETAEEAERALAASSEDAEGRA